MTERDYLVALYSFLPFGSARTRLILSYFGSAQKAWKADKDSLIEIGLKANIVNNFFNYKSKFDPAVYLKRLEKLSIKFTTFKDPDYPENLSGLDGAPCVLYYIGTLKKSDKNAVAIVGSRKPSSYGREVAEKFSQELASLGITIVSGLALGIDAVAHRACIEVEGRTIAVLASGLDIISPASNYFLALEAVKKGGAIVSEYPLGQAPLRSSFPSRNRIISGLSKAVIVVEGLEKSGTLLTASAAAEQARSVFAVPGQISSPLSAAPHFLIQNGAKMVTSVSDILEELNLQLKVDLEEVEKIMPTDGDEIKILEILTKETFHLDEIARIAALKVSNVSAILTVMELKGLVKNLGNGVYKKI